MDLFVLLDIETFTLQLGCYNVVSAFEEFCILGFGVHFQCMPQEASNVVEWIIRCLGVYCWIVI